MIELTVSNKLGFRAVFHVDPEKAASSILEYFGQIKSTNYGKLLVQYNFDIMRLVLSQISKFIFNGPHFLNIPTVESVKANAKYQMLPAMDGSGGLTLVDLTIPEEAICDFTMTEEPEAAS